MLRNGVLWELIGIGLGTGASTETGIYKAYTRHMQRHRDRVRTGRACKDRDRAGTGHRIGTGQAQGM